MKPRNRYTALIVAYILPVFLYLLPVAESKFIPGIKDNIDVIYGIIFIVVIIIYGIVLVRYWKKLPIKRSQKWFITLITAFVLFLHCILFMYIEIRINFSLSSKEVVLTRNFYNHKIYIMEERGIFNIHKRSEIGYSRLLSPFYHVYFSTYKNIRLAREEPEKMVFEEFEYVEDSVRTKNFLQKVKQHKRVDSVIQITKKDLSKNEERKNHDDER